MTTRNYSNTGSDAEAAVLVGSGDASVALANYSGFPSPPYIAALDPDTSDEEVVLVTGVVGSTATITRAYDGTTAKTHAAGAVFRHVASAIDFREANNHVNATTGAHGVAGALVGTSDTQTLSNKTLVSPAVSNPTVTGTLTGASGNFSGSVSVGSLGSSTGAFSGNVIVGGTLTVAGTTTLGATSTGALSSTTGAFSGAVTCAGTLGVTGTFTGSSGTFSGTLTAATGDFTTAVIDEIELVQLGADPAPTAGRSSIWARADSAVYFAPQGQGRRRLAMCWGSGTTLPTLGAIVGDTYYHTGLSSLLRYNGSTWRQIDGPVEVANMAARPTHADLHPGFQVFSLADDEVYTYDGTHWRNGLAGGFTPSGAGNGDYITGIMGSTQGAVDGSGNLLVSLGHTFSANTYIAQTSSGDGTLGNATQQYPVSKTTSTLTVGCRRYDGTSVPTGTTVRCTWQVIGYND